MRREREKRFVRLCGRIELVQFTLNTLKHSLNDLQRNTIMKLEELMADEIEALQDDGVSQYAEGGRPTSHPSSAPRELEFRRGDYPNFSDYRAQRMEARNRRAMNRR